MEQLAPNPIAIMAFSTVLGALPIMAVTMTSFLKISVVLFIVRNALGIQQTPPNMLIYGLAIILSGFVMAPTFREIYSIIANPLVDYQSVPGLEQVFKDGVEPLRRFMLRLTSPEQRGFFIESAQKVWANQPDMTAQSNDMIILIPSFMAAELTRAFEIGFLIYLPFLVIDFVVSAVLMAMGMQMMSPPVISTPLKLLLFVMLDGWQRLVEGLILSYTPPVV
jgi:type III secretion protein R